MVSYHSVDGKDTSAAVDFYPSYPGQTLQCGCLDLHMATKLTFASVPSILLRFFYDEVRNKDFVSLFPLPHQGFLRCNSVEVAILS